ncbi:MAG: hypothetical protein M3R25_01390 [Bacteroidota bacterium]|nr:hypothetical protein [Bacteroidota bacterium]
MLKNKYLAYIILLAGWLSLCYWLYSKEIYPSIHPDQGLKWPVFEDDLELPLAFRWKSDIPLAGQGFEVFSESIRNNSRGDSVLIITGGYFLDEADTAASEQSIGINRVNRMIQYYQLDPRKTIINIEKKELDADVRSVPFEAVSFEWIPMPVIIREIGDTTEICFPVKDSLLLPKAIIDKIEDLARTQLKESDVRVFVTGTADGTGIAESSDIAVARAIVIRDILMRAGWTEERIVITTGQRNESEPIRNRCAQIYFE